MQVQINQIQTDKVLKSQGISQSSTALNQLIYQNFATKPTDSFLGISIQKQRLYVIQKKSIGVFEYFISVEGQISQKGPILIKEIFLPFQISKYIITEKYICVKSKNKTQIRDSEFEKVFYSENKGILTARKKQQNQKNGNCIELSCQSMQELQLQCQIIGDEMISWKVLMERKQNALNPQYLRQYWSQRYHILKKTKSLIKFKSEIIDPTNKSRKIQISKPPLFVDQLGYIQNFYIWPTSTSDIQIGIFFNQKQLHNVTENALYEICNFQLKDTNIKKLFYYDFKTKHSNGKTKDGPHLFLAVCENMTKDNSKIKIVVFEILPEQTISQDESQNQALNSYLDQFNQLQKQKKSQQSLSNSLLLNELLSNQQKTQRRSNANKPTAIMESFTIKNSCSLKRVFFNPASKVLWINDASDLVYRVKLVEQGDIKKIRQNSFSFIENLQGYQNGEVGPDLQGIIYDDFPIFKVKAYALEMGLRRRKLSNPKPQLCKENEVISSVKNQQKNIEKQEKQREVLEVDDKELQNISQQKPSESRTDLLNSAQNQNIRQMKSFQTQTQETDVQILQKNEKEYFSVEIQTEQFCNSSEQKQAKQKTIIKVSDLSEVLKQLNFNKVQDLLIRFSTIFSGQVTKNVNKLKDFNTKAKQEIKLKINGEIHELLEEVFTSFLNDALTQKVQKQVAKARQFVEKLFHKQIQHFNLMILEQKVKQENIKKYIIQEQLRSMDIIKEASSKFLDVTKVRQMQKIAYNQVVIESIREVGKKIDDLQTKVDEMIKESQQIETKIIEDVKEIKETFKLLIELQDNLSKEEENEEVEEQSSQSGFESGSDGDNDEEEGEQRKRGLEQKRVPKYFGVQTQNYQQRYQHIPPPQVYQQRAPGWKYPPYPQPPVNYSYPHYSGVVPPTYNVSPHYVPHYPPSPYSQSYPPHHNPYMNPPPVNQHQYFPPPSQVHPSFSEVRPEPQTFAQPLKGQKKRKNKSSKLSSSRMKNQ